MCLSNIMFVELQVKEHQATLEKEAEQIRMVNAGKEPGNIIKRGIEKFANLLISIGEFLKRKYCPDASEKIESSPYLSKGSCRC